MKCKSIRSQNGITRVKYLKLVVYPKCTQLLIIISWINKPQTHMKPEHSISTAHCVTLRVVCLFVAIKYSLIFILLFNSTV